MASVMAATYPDHFAAIGVGSGCEYAATATCAGYKSADPDQAGRAAYREMGPRARLVPLIAFQGDNDAVDLAWDNGDAKLTFVFGKPHWNTKYVLWLSRAHAWHPIRLQRYWEAKDKFWHDEWEVTKFVPHGKLWRVAEGTVRNRELKGGTVVDPTIRYSIDFRVLSEKYGSDVDEKELDDAGARQVVGAHFCAGKEGRRVPPPGRQDLLAREHEGAVRPTRCRRLGCS